VGRGPGRQSSADRPAAQAHKTSALENLRGVYAEVDGLLEGWTCDSSTDCCRFGVTGREPYPTSVEIAELERGVRARGGLPKRRSLPHVDERRCALLSDEGKCLVYASRPFGCRTFFCERARGPAGEPARSGPKAEIARLGRAVADLAARFDPADPGPRPLSKVTAGWDERGDRSGAPSRGRRG
jgi:Fe-S-cluster containining protein